MTTLFRVSHLRKAMLAATLGTASGAYADTIVDKDMLIDDKSSANESYRVENGATLTANDAITHQVTVSAGHLAMSGGEINRYLEVGSNGTAAIHDAAIGAAFLMGDTHLTNTTIKSQLVVSDAQLTATNISAQQFVAYDATSIIEKSFFDNTRGYYGGMGAVTFSATDGTLTDSMVKGKEVGIYLTGYGEKRYSVNLIGSSVWSVDGPALLVASGHHAINLQNGSTAGSQSGELLSARRGSDVALTLNASRAAGNIHAEDTAIVDVVLTDGSTLSGAVSNVNSLRLDGTSLYEMTASSDMKTLSMAGGMVAFAPTATGNHATLTLGSLAGSGHFMMNVDTAAWQSDMLDVTGHASGKYTLHVAAAGREAASSDALALVRTGGGDAEFALNGERLDLGAWQHILVRNGNNWELVQAAGATSASTDAMLSMASAPLFMHEGELNVLRSRLNDTRLAQKSGMWGTALHSRSDVDGAEGSAYRLEQNGMMFGGDKVTELAAGELTAGAYLGQSTGQVKHARGDKSRITSYGGGVYAVLASDSGWYSSGSAQISHFDNKLSARMSDGGTARAGWNSWGYGMTLEGGRYIELTDAASLTPYIGLNGWLNPSETVKLTNGMTAETGDGRSVQAETGVRVDTNLKAGDITMMPYMTAALSQALIKNGSTRINDAYDFTNDFTGMGGNLSGGINVKVTPSAMVWLAASYAKSEHAESPVAGNLGLRVDF
jgi:outer membrane autotransporter protein